MAGLTGSTIADSYDQLIISNNASGGNTSNLITLQDGDGVTTYCVSMNDASTAKSILSIDGSHANGTALQIDNSAGDGDVSVEWQLGGTTTWLMGIEDGDSDSLKICHDSTMGTDERLSFLTASTVVNEDSSDIDFRVEGAGNINLLFCDAGDDRIGINNATPAAALEVTGEILCGEASATGGGGGFYCTKDNISGEYGGWFSISNAGGALKVSGESTNVNDIMQIANTSGGWTGGKKIVKILDTDNAGDNYLIHAVGGASDENNPPDDVAFHVTSAGTVSATASFVDGIDYAELFESKDGSAFAFGSTVVLDGDKVRLAEDGEVPFGVVRPNGVSSTTGGSHMQWGGRFKKDDFGVPLREEIECFEIEHTDDEGTKTWTYHTIGETDVALPNGVETQKSFRKIETDEYDGNIEWIPRQDRDEWNVIGLLGQVQILKGQPVASSWKKMKSISDSLDLYYIFPCP